MFQFLWDLIAIPLGFIMRWCYLLVSEVLHLPAAYIFAMFLFTLITKLLLFPLSLKQQRSSATTQAYQPMINEINERYAKDPQKRQQELDKFQKEYGFSPMAGCLPLLIQFPLIFGLMQVVYKPLTYMLRIPETVLSVLIGKASEVTGVEVTNRYIETTLIEQIKTNPATYRALDGAAAGVGAAEFDGYISQVANLDMSIGTINLWETPKLEWSWSLLIPIFSIVTILISSFVTMWAARGKSQGQDGKQQKTMQNTNRIMMLFSAAMFGYMSFTLPAAFSLYWGFSNIIIIFQSMILRKIVNADTIREEAEAKIAARKAEAKAAKKVKVKTKTGEEEEKELAGAELARYRLQRARELDEQRYSETAAEEAEESAKPPAEKAEAPAGEPPAPEDKPKKKSKKK